MTSPSPIQTMLEEYKIPIEVDENISDRGGAASGKYLAQLLSEFLAWGDEGCTVLATAGIVELEYASIQKSFGIFDAPCRGTIEIQGKEKLEFIDRLSTQKLLDVEEGDARLTFIVNQKGRIIADAIIRHLGEKLWIDVDITVVQTLIEHLNNYVIMEDVTVEDITNKLHWIWCVGPTSLESDSGKVEPHKLPIDLLGIEGSAFASHPDQTKQLWETLIESGGRPVGWYALNMSRVEQLTPIFLIDFDTNNLPHETSLIQSRVRFDKGCYLGQEIVARMESLGKPKQQLVQLFITNGELPIAGSQLWLDNSASGTPVGVVTSSAISPMKGGDAAVIAMLGKKYIKVGTHVFVYIGSELFEVTVSSLQSDKDAS